MDYVDRVLAELEAYNITYADVVRGLEGVFDRFPAEVPGVVDALHAGEIDGHLYTGTCACLIGTIAKVRGLSHIYNKGEAAVVGAFLDYMPDYTRPEERWIYFINPYDTPANDQIAAKTLEIINEWQAKRVYPWMDSDEVYAALSEAEKWQRYAVWIREYQYGARPHHSNFAFTSLVAFLQRGGTADEATLRRWFQKDGFVYIQFALESFPIHPITKAAIEAIRKNP